MRWQRLSVAIILLLFPEDGNVQAKDDVFRHAKGSKSTKGKGTKSKGTKSSKSKLSGKLGKYSKGSKSSHRESNSKGSKSSHRESQEPPTKATTTTPKPVSSSGTEFPSDAKPDEDKPEVSMETSNADPTASPTCLECDDGPNQMLSEQWAPDNPELLTYDWSGEAAASTDGEKPLILQNSNTKETSGSSFQNTVSILGLGFLCLMSWWIIV
jgi:hypothetical protein